MLAEATTTISLTPDAVTFGKVCGVLITLATVAASLVTMWSKLRRRPPLHEEYQTKSDARAMEERLSDKIDDVSNERKESSVTLHNKIDALRETTESCLRDFAQQIGGVQGAQRIQQMMLRIRKKYDEET